MSANQQQLGELIVNSLRISADNLVTMIIESNQELDLSQEQLETLSNLVNANCVNQTDRALEQLVRYYG